MRRRRQPRPYDVVTPTPEERRLAEIARRQRDYVLVSIPFVLLVLFGFFVPAPVAIRVIALVIALLLVPLRVVAGNGRRRR